MKILVTAGNTQVPLDRVRCITNIFTGRTGTQLALCAHARGHDVTLLSSRPGAVAELSGKEHALNERWNVCPYRTFDDLRDLLQDNILHNPPDVILHSAAVSDYQSGGIYAPSQGTSFDDSTLTWQSAESNPAMQDVSAGKVKSDFPELWLRLRRTPKLVDMVRKEWNYRGILVKFKLEVGISDEMLLQIAERSRKHSQADLMVANTLEGANSWAYVGSIADTYSRVERQELAEYVMTAVENIFRDKKDA